VIEIVEKAIRAQDARTGDVLVTSSRDPRLIWRVSIVGRSVTLHHARNGFTVADVDTLVRVRRRTREERLDAPGTRDTGHTWFVGRRSR